MNVNSLTKDVYYDLELKNGTTHEGAKFVRVIDRERGSNTIRGPSYKYEFLLSDGTTESFSKDQLKSITASKRYNLRSSAGGKRGTRKNRKASRKNRKASRKNRKSTRRNRRH